MSASALLVLIFALSGLMSTKMTLPPWDVTGVCCAWVGLGVEVGAVVMGPRGRDSGPGRDFCRTVVPGLPLRGLPIVILVGTSCRRHVKIEERLGGEKVKFSHKLK